jgi:hypothetical protein
VEEREGERRMLCIFLLSPALSSLKGEGGERVL